MTKQFVINNIPLLISLFALFFTIFSFWWLNWRRGKVVVNKPIKFGFNYTKARKKIVVQLPLVFYNNGASTIIVNNLRLKIFSQAGNTVYLFFNNTFKDLESNDERQWGYAFAINGRKTFSRVFVFMKNDFEFIIPNDYIKITLEAQFNNKQKWLKLIDFKLLTPERHHKTMYEILRAYDT